MDTAVQPRSSSTPMILGIVGGFVLAIGSFLDWATVSVNFDKLASALGIDPAQIPDSVRAQSTVSVTGWKSGDGKWTFFAGVVVLVFAALLITGRNARLFGILMVVGGAVGAGVALYDATIQKNNALNDAAGALSGAGLPGKVTDFFSLSLDIGIWLCAIGGIVAVIGGIMAIASGGATVPAMADEMPGSTPPPADGGFGTSSVAGSMAPTTPVIPMAETPAAPMAETPAAPMAETPPAPTAETPAAPMAETPAAPMAETPATPVSEPAPLVSAPEAAVAPEPVTAGTDAPTESLADDVGGGEDSSDSSSS